MEKWHQIYTNKCWVVSAHARLGQIWRNPNIGWKFP